MKIYLATDHAGFEHKESIKKYLSGKDNIQVIDCGADVYDGQDDYPDTIAPAARAVSRDKYARGIIFGGSGQGEAMVANKFPRIRATVYYGSEPEIIALSREHNNANILSIGARFVDLEETKQAIDVWLAQKYGLDERHERRIEKIHQIEDRLYSFITKITSRVRK